MKIESFVAGVILGAFFSQPQNQELTKDALQKTAGFITDILGKSGEKDADVIINSDNK